MKTVTVDYFGVSGTGRNVTEAKQDAGRTIQRIMRNLSPSIFSHRGYSVVISPTSHGWSYQIIHPDSEGHTIGSSSCGDSREDCTRSAVFHLLSINREVGDLDFPEWAENYVDRSWAISEWESNDRFQRAYRYAKSTGVEDCHSYACANSRDPQFA